MQTDREEGSLLGCTTTVPVELKRWVRGGVGSANLKAAPSEGPDDESPDLCPPCVLPVVRLKERPKVREPQTGFSGSGSGHSSGGESAGQTGAFRPLSRVLGVSSVTWGQHGACRGARGLGDAWKKGSRPEGAGAWEPCGLRRARPAGTGQPSS